MKAMVAAMWIRLGTVILVSGLAVTPAIYAQAMGQGGSTQSRESVNQMQNQLHYLTDVQRHNAIDPHEVAAYKKFYQEKSDNPDVKIKLGQKFFKKYPNSPFTEDVDVGLSNAYLAKQDWKDYYTFADKALALNPDEIDVLTMLGWVIPHQYNPNTPSASQQLQTAETDEKHALDLLSKLKKPKGVSDQRFAAMKAQKSQQAHSALGLIYFRRADYADSVTQLQESTQAGSAVDPTDVYVLGVDLQQLNRHADAAKAFARCGQIAGPLQARCKQGATQQNKLAGQAH